MKSIPFVILVVFCIAIWEFGSTNPVAMSCDSCGAECTRACGTRHFRSCCLNYVRKRSSKAPLTLNQLRYELMYQQFPYGNSKLQNKNDREQKPRQVSNQNLAQTKNENVDDETTRNFFKPWKDESPAVEAVASGSGSDEYDNERRQASVPIQHFIYDV